MICVGERMGAISPLVGAQIDRICLKALSKRAADRYQTAQELLDDLAHFLHQEEASSAAVVAAANPSMSPAPCRVIPKGLRAFDAHDADFFLELLPGPRDRYG